MESTQELIYQILAIIVSGVLISIGGFLKQLIKTKIDVTKYGFENDKVERILDNAISFSEKKGKEIAMTSAKSISQSDRVKFAKIYIEKIDKSIITTYGEKLESMIDRKIIQKFGK